MSAMGIATDEIQRQSWRIQTLIMASTATHGLRKDAACLKELIMPKPSKSRIAAKPTATPVSKSNIGKRPRSQQKATWTFQFIDEKLLCWETVANVSPKLKKSDLDPMCISNSAYTCVSLASFCSSLKMDKVFANMMIRHGLIKTLEYRNRTLIPISSFISLVNTTIDEIKDTIWDDAESMYAD